MNHHRHRHGRALLVCLLFAACAPSAAWAQEEGVTIDPGAPSSKEYALPLDSEREAAAGLPGGASKRSTRRFGEGITPDGGPAARIRAAQRKKAERAGKKPSKPKDAPDRGGGNPNNSQSARTELAANPTAQKLLASSPTGSEGIVAMVVGGAAVLAMALGGGLLWRRRGEEPMS